MVVFSPEGQFLNRIGNQGLTDYPNGIDVLPNGNILVGDSHGNKFHICIFLPDGTLLCEYECPYVKVSTVHEFQLLVIKFSEVGPASIFEEKFDGAHCPVCFELCLY